MKSRNYLWPLLRWLLVPLLLYLFVQYLEGPSYREIVRGGPFLLAVFAISGLASEFLKQIWSTPLWVTPLQTILLPSLFILSVQFYFNGGHNNDALPILVACAIPMGINLLLYLISLYNWKYRGSPPVSNDAPGTDTYKIELLRRNSEGRTAGVSFSTSGSRPFPEAIYVDGYSRDHAISLLDYWPVIEQDGLGYFETPITIRETIIKFGETQQLVDDYLLRINVYKP